MAVLLMATACKPAPGIPTTSPEGGAVQPTEAVAPETATVLRYDASARTLRQTGRLELVQRGAGQYAEVALDLEAEIGITPQGDRLQVVWSVADVTGLELGGALQTEGEDPAVFLETHGVGAYLSDLRGQAEMDSSLPQNVERETKLAQLRQQIADATAAGKPTPVIPGLQMLGFLPPLLQLPTLPEEALPLNEPVVVRRQEETELGDTGLVLPFDVEMKYTLVRIEASGDAKLAEMVFEGSASGSQDGPGGEIVIESQQRGTLMFDLGRRVPVSYESTRTETIEMGQFSGETETTLRATWED
jgi:co-chaperonin GroES (HSP10)